MKPKSLVKLPALICLFAVLGSACGRQMIEGQVLDAETGKHIEGAAVYIYWGKSGPGPPGLAGGVQVEVGEDLSDTEGLFNIPKYSPLRKSYEMTVYKKGYVCWNSVDIFPAFEKRKGFKLKNGMVIKLERFKVEYSEEKHAFFTNASSINRNEPGLFYDAIKSEIELSHEIFRRNRRK